MNDPAIRLVTELQLPLNSIKTSIRLLDEGCTVPFIARYRKEATGGLNDIQLRQLEERLLYMRELDERRHTVLKSIDEQGKLTPELKKAIESVSNKTRLEDLYRPYMPKRRTKAQIAREAGLEDLANTLLNQPEQDPVILAKKFLNPDKKIISEQDALDGARQILMEDFSENAELVGKLREYSWQQGLLQSKLVKGKETEAKKYSDYFDSVEAVKSIPSHRMLAMLRGQKEGLLQLSLIFEADAEADPKSFNPAEAMIASQFNVNQKNRPADQWLFDSVRWAWKVKLSTHIELDIKKTLREQSEQEAIDVFAKNLKDLMLAAPAGHKTVLGLDPGIRTGVKVAIVDSTGKLLDTATVYPHPPRNQWRESLQVLAQLVKKHHINLIAIGNGTASRETDKLAGELISLCDSAVQKIVISEAGASVYSASVEASEEFPDIDVSLRGAISIARRLQDPLAELVKIDPKSIGVGQYQHDVNQTKLGRCLDNVVEDCVNSVGVELNTASASLLSRVAGLNPNLAKNIVEFRNNNGRFSNRETLLSVPRLGPKAYEQSAGFLRVANGENPLDCSAVHPEAYQVVNNILKTTQKNISSIIGNTSVLRKLKPKDFITAEFGEPTIKDILMELEKPGRDPRPEFKTATFKEGVEKISDLKPGMRLEGVVSNVTRFGAFVDIGVHQDGLVHISEMADKFVSDPHQVVSTGDIVKVRVVDVDIERKRIGLTMKSSTDERLADKPNKPDAKPKHKSKPTANGQTAMAAAFNKLRS